MVCGGTEREELRGGARLAHVVGLRLAWVVAGLLGVVVHDAEKCMGRDFAVVV